MTWTPGQLAAAARFLDGDINCHCNEINCTCKGRRRGMKLYELPPRQEPRPKIYGLNPNGDENGVVEFDHIDGMYSYCVAYDGEGNKLGVCHLAATTPLIPHGDGWKIEPDQEKLCPKE